MSDLELRIRRAVMHASQGKTAKLVLDGADLRHVLTYTKDFARSRLLQVSLTEDGPHLIIKVTGKLASSAKYGEVDALEIGQSHLFEVDPTEHQLIRSSMAYRTNKSGRRFSCVAEDGGLRVTRLPGNDAERSQHPYLAGTGRRPSKYGLERLLTESSIVLNVPKAEHERVRVAAYRAGVLSGVTLTCRAQDDGSILVAKAQATGPDNPSIRPSKATRWGLERLERERQITIGPLIYAEIRALRSAVTTKSKLTGWVLRCRQQDDGKTVVVYRTDISTTAQAAE